MAKAKTKNRKEPVEHTETWACALCDPPCLEIPNAQVFIQHCQDLHPEVVTMREDGRPTVKAKGQTIQALDGKDWYSNVTAFVTADGRKVAERAESGPRDKTFWGYEE